uniref:Uncharacterized protein n=1 Tax=Meloidogyne hapla TaxID=6305 RepID=A0A1I8BLY9_MELHA
MQTTLEYVENNLFIAEFIRNNELDALYLPLIYTHEVIITNKWTQYHQGNFEIVNNILPQKHLYLIAHVFKTCQDVINSKPGGQSSGAGQTSGQ